MEFSTTKVAESGRRVKKITDMKGCVCRFSPPVGGRDRRRVVGLPDERGKGRRRRYHRRTEGLHERSQGRRTHVPDFPAGPQRSDP